MLEKRWLSTKEACWYTSLSRNTLYKLLKEEKITAKKAGRKLLWDRYSIDEFLESETDEDRKVKRILESLR